MLAPPQQEKTTFAKEVDDSFLVVAVKRRSNYTSKSNPPSKNVLKLTLALVG